MGSVHLQEFANIIWVCFNIKYQIQIFSNTLITIINKSKNSKCSGSLSSTNPNITKQLLKHTNTEIFKFLWYLAVPNFYPWVQSILVRCGQYWSSVVNIGQVGSISVRCGQYWSGQVNIGQVGSILFSQGQYQSIWVNISP